jgi:hypothetical protein
MREIIVSLLTVLIFATTANAQVPPEFQRYEPRLIKYGNLPEDGKAEDVQQNFVNQIWRTGTVLFRSTLSRVTVPLIFDVYNNRLYFLRDSLIMEFTQPIKEFTIPVLTKKDTVDLLFRSGYPEIEKNTDGIFYQVIIDGNFQLLKCMAKTIGLYKDREIPEERRNRAKELWYAFLPNGKMVLLKTDKDYILKEMPEYADAIQKICADEKLKLKNEEQLQRLFIELNK